MFNSVNRLLLPFKVHFFFKSGGLAFLPMLSAITRQRGVSAQAVGLMWTVIPISSASFSVLGGTVADRLKSHKILMQISYALMVFSITGFFFLPNIPIQPNSPLNGTLSLECDDYGNQFEYFCSGESSIKNFHLDSLPPYIPDNSLNISILEKSCSLDCRVHAHDVNQQQETEGRIHSQIEVNISNADFIRIQKGHRFQNVTCVQINGRQLKIPMNDECGKRMSVVCIGKCGEHKPTRDISLSYIFGTTELWLIFLCNLMIISTYQVSATLMDTLCTVALGKKSHMYGRQRLFGAMGIGLMGLVGSALVNHYSKGQSETNYTPAIIITATFGIIGLLATLNINVNVPGKEKQGATIRDVLCSFEFWLLMGSAAVTGASYGVIWTFEYIYVEDVAAVWDPNFDDNKLLQGLMLFTDTVIGEMLFFFFSPYIIKKLTPIHTFSLTLAATTLRAFLYSVASNPWQFLAIHLLHGVSFGVFFTNMIIFASQLAPKGAQATLQSTVITSLTLGKSVGSFGGGILLQSVGGSKTYLYLSIFVACYTLLYILVTCLYTRRKNIRSTDDERGEYEKPDDAIKPNGSEELRPQVFESQGHLDMMA